MDKELTIKNLVTLLKYQLYKDLTTKNNKAVIVSINTNTSQFYDIAHKMYNDYVYLDIANELSDPKIDDIRVYNKAIKLV